MRAAIITQPGESGGPAPQVLIGVLLTGTDAINNLQLKLIGPYRFALQPPTSVPKNGTLTTWIERDQSVPGGATGYLTGPGFALLLPAQAPDAAAAASAPPIGSRAPAAPRDVSRSGAAQLSRYAAAGIAKTSLTPIAEPATTTKPVIHAKINPSSLTITLARGQSQGSAKATVSNLTGVTLSSILPAGSLPEFQFGSNCTAKTAAQDSCTITVDATVAQGEYYAGERVGITADGANIGDLDVTVDDGYSIISASPASIQFGNISVGDRAEEIVTVVNENPLFAAPALTSSLAGSDNFSISGCKEVPVPASCALAVTYSPSEQTPDAATLELQAADGGSPIQISLRGQGTPGTLDVAPISLTFDGTVGDAQQVILSNPASHAITLGAVATDGPFTANGQCGTIQPGSSCQLTVAYTPAPGTAGQEASGQLLIAAQPPAKYFTIPLASAENLPSIAAQTTTLDFGVQAIGKTSGLKGLAIANNGTQPANIAVAVSGDFAAPITSCGTIAPSSACNLAFAFTPSAPGQREGVALITGAGSPTVINLAGIGILPPPQPSTQKGIAPQLGLGIGLAAILPSISPRRAQADSAAALEIEPKTVVINCATAGHAVAAPISIANTGDKSISLLYVTNGPFELKGCETIAARATCIAGVTLAEPEDSTKGILLIQDKADAAPLAAVQLVASVAVAPR